MKLFKILQIYLAIVGIRPNQKSSFNLHNVAILLVFGLSFLLIIRSRLGFVNTFNLIVTLSVFCFGFLLSILKSKKLFELIDKCEQTVNNGELLIFQKKKNKILIENLIEIF